MLQSFHNVLASGSIHPSSDRPPLSDQDRFARSPAVKALGGVRCWHLKGWWAGGSETSRQKWKRSPASHKREFRVGKAIGLALDSCPDAPVTCETCEIDVKIRHVGDISDVVDVHIPYIGEVREVRDIDVDDVHMVEASRKLGDVGAPRAKRSLRSNHVPPRPPIKNHGKKAFTMEAHGNMTFLNILEVRAWFGARQCTQARCNPYRSVPTIVPEAHVANRAVRLIRI